MALGIGDFRYHVKAKTSTIVLTNRKGASTKAEQCGLKASLTTKPNQQLLLAKYLKQQLKL